jgi:hypothetical protein
MWHGGRVGIPHLTVVGGTIMVRAMLRRELGTVGGFSPEKQPFMGETPAGWQPSDSTCHGGNLNDATQNDGVPETWTPLDWLRDRLPDADRTRAVGGVMRNVGAMSGAWIAKPSAIGRVSPR